jgi:CheY-like chemotaxis protein
MKWKNVMAKALVVEDNPVNQKLMRKLLESMGHSVFCASTGEEGWAMVESGSFDIIFLDMHLPQMDGFELARKIRDRLGEKARIVAVTAMAMTGDRERILEAGCDDYIAKPIFLKDFKELLVRHLPQSGGTE